MRSLVIFLTISRAGNLPTIWSNCLAGWWLGGHGNPGRLTVLLLGASLLYIGGAFLNDALDADSDRQHRRSRPIPSGLFPARLAVQGGIAFLAAGLLCLFGISRLTGTLGLGVSLLAVTFNLTHRSFVLSPGLLGGCRLFLYAAAASAGANGTGGWAVWCGIAAATYAAGVRLLATIEAPPRRDQYWPVVLLAAPIALALTMDVNEFRVRGIALSAVVGLNSILALRRMLWPAARDIAKTAAALTAGMILVDWLAVVDAPIEMAFVFVLLFAAVFLLQRGTTTV